jgi:hypothetical protein
LTVQNTGHSFMIMAVREDGDETGGDYWLPIVDPGAVAPRLSAGEQILFGGSARVAATALVGNNWQPVWTMPSPAHFVITENRLAFVCREFVKGGTSIGFGGLGVAVALTSTAVKQVRAARIRRGKAAVGQVRFEWLSNMILERKQPAPALLVKNPAPTVTVHLTTRDDAGRYVRLSLRHSTPEITSEMLAWHARDIASRRLDSPVVTRLDDAALSDLRRVIEDPAGRLTDSGQLLWSLAGATQPVGAGAQPSGQ